MWPLPVSESGNRWFESKETRPREISKKSFQEQYPDKIPKVPLQQYQERQNECANVISKQVGKNARSEITIWAAECKSSNE